MSDDSTTAATEPEPRRRPRFPWAPAALCAASLAMAGWAWMRYSYAWDVTNIPLATCGEELYVECMGEGLVGDERILADFIVGNADATGPVELVRCNLKGDLFVGRVTARAMRVYGEHTRSVPLLDTAASRLHPASVASLVVAAFVTFVFALYLRRWVQERSAAASA